jgi:hypothetical protein
MRCATDTNYKELPYTGSHDQLLQLSRVISFQILCKARAAFTKQHRNDVWKIASEIIPHAASTLKHSQWYALCHKQRAQ